jgi:hypothetical protein
VDPRPEGRGDVRTRDSSERWVPCAPSPGFTVSGAPLEVFLSPIAPPQAVGPRPPSIRPAFSEPHTYRRSRRIVSSHEVRMNRPSAVQRCCVHFPTPESVVQRAGTTQRVPFRPHGFSPSRRFSPLHRPRVCFTSLRPWGSRPCRRPLAPTAEAMRPGWPFRSCTNPSKSVLACSRTVSPRPVSTLTLRLVELAPGSAPVTGSTPTCTGKLEPAEAGLHVPATPWGATAADESAAMQLCKHDPRSEDRTCALARSLDAASPATEMAASETPRQSGRLRGVAPLTSP